MDKYNTYIYSTVIIIVVGYVIYRYFTRDNINIDIKTIENIQFILKNKLVKFNNNSKNVALMVESRIFPNTEFIIRQFCRYLPADFSMQIYATKNVYDDYMIIANKLNNNINVEILPYELKSLKDYNDIMLNISFWKLLTKYDRVLIFQNDTMLYKNNIADFYQYDYIGAPWYPIRQIAKNVGNGGLSMRNISAMIYCLENEKTVKIPYNTMYNYEKYFVFKGKYPEDVFFSYAMLQFDYNVADMNTASLFSIESCLYNDYVLGSHKLDVYNSQLYKTLLLKSIFTPNMKYNIPLKIYQTWHTKDLPPLMRKYTELLQKTNPEFEYHLYDDNDCKEFIRKHFDSDVLMAFEKLVPGAYKADLWRYCILYINGGIYIDIKYVCINQFKLISFLDKEYYVLDRDVFDLDNLINNQKPKKGIYNGLMVCKPKNKLLLILIKQIVKNVKNKFYGYNSLNPTGPILFADMYTKYVKKINDNDFELKYLSDGMSISYNNVPILEIYEEYRTESFFNQKVSHYGKLWNERKIYKE
jgi:mannosyltransferase OCH1-like enzyme